MAKWTLLLLIALLGPPSCHAQTATACNTTAADIQFLLDTSGSVGSVDFDKVRAFVRKFAVHFDIGPDRVNIGVTSFGSTPQNEFWLNQHTDKASLLSAIDQIQYRGGNTYTAEALECVRENALTPTNGDRPNVPNILIVVTDGQSADRQATLQQAKKLHNLGVNVLAVGVGDSVDQTELAGIASSAQNVYTVSNFDALTTVEAALEKTVCAASTPPPVAVAADIQFLLDTSGSVGTADFAKVRAFVKTFADHFDIGPDAVHIGVTSFSSTPHNEFWLKQHTDKASLLAAIDQIQYRGGNTYTAEALQFVRENAFTAANGDRPNVPNILIVITDGQSTDQAATLQQATKLHNLGVTVLAVGVGDSVDQTELAGIASSAQNVYTVSNFDALTTLLGSLEKAANAATIPPPVAAAADIQFLLDTSGSVGTADFAKVRAFVKTFADHFDIGPDAVHIGVASFSSTPHNEFWLKQHTDKASLLAAIDQIQYRGGNTYTAEALQFVRENAFSAANGDRPNVPNILIVITDGQSTDQAATLQQATNLHNLGVNVLAVGVGDSVDQTELAGIASSAQNVYTVSNFDALTTLLGSLGKAANAATTPPPAAVAADIQFLLDTSGSVGTADFAKVRAFVKTFADHFDIGPDSVHIGVASFSSTTHNEFWLKQHTDKASLLAAIDQIQYRGGNTYTAEALQFVRENAFTAANGDRPNVPNILIVITDGQSTDQAATLQQATNLHNLGVNVLAVGVGDSVDQTELAGIASSAQNVYTVSNFDALTTLLGSLEKAANAAITPPPAAVAADIQFLLDTSGSVGTADFAKVRAFVKTFADHFDIGPDSVHIGVASFSSTTHNEFWLKQHTDKASLLAAIDQIQYRGGNTYTAEALQFVRENAFTAANGDRPNVPNILIVITDGQSTDQAATLQQAKKLHNLGVNVLAVGVGDSVDQTELAGIASSAQNVYTVSNFDALTTLLGSLEKAANAATTPPPVCDAVAADIQFLLDTSGSVGSADFDNIRGFVRKFAEHFDIGPDSAHIGITSFGSSSYNEFWLKQHTDKASLLAAIDQIQYRGGNTYTEEALRFIREQAFTLANGDRPNVPNILIVISDGQSADRQATLQQATELHNLGVDVLAVGVGDSVDLTELAGIASSAQNVYTVSNFNALTTLQESLERTACGVTTPPPVCDAVAADIQFLLDTSGSVGSADFDNIRGFVRKFAEHFDIGPDNVHIGITSFGSKLYNEFWLKQHTDKASLLAAIDQIQYRGGNTYTAKALRFIQKHAFILANGDRPNAANILIVITDGQSANRKATVQQGTELHNLGVNVLAVGVGDSVDLTELAGIASSAQNVYTVSNFNALTTLQESLERTACAATIPAPVDGNWSPWAAFSPCSTSCSGGVQYRVRTCSDPPPANGGADCPGQSREVRDCNTQPCPPSTTGAPHSTTAAPMDGNWSPWSAFSPCSTPCDGGVQYRTRTCSDPPPANGGADCPGQNREERNCNTQPCPTTLPPSSAAPVDGNWSPWAAFSPCSTTCGGGVQYRVRTCSDPSASNGGADCPGQSREERDCNTQPCPTTLPPSSATPVDGNWSPWAAFSPCSTPCGGGVQYRVRTCSDPSPANGGADCPGQSFEERDCNTQSCPTTLPPTTATPVDGNWSPWSAFSPCSTPCDGGVQYRTRTCSDPPPANGGADCPGQNREERDCNTQPCPTSLPPSSAAPVDGNWSPWAAFSPCSTPCDGGVQYRTRTCSDPPPSNGGADCPGQSREERDCNTQPCPTRLLPTSAPLVDGNWSPWAAFSPCSTTCGGGVQYRVRTCSDPSPANGGADCPGQSHEERDCNTQPCPTTLPSTTAAPLCDAVAADILFLLDTSYSVGNDDFAKVLNFVKEFAEHFDIGPDSVNIGVTSFGTNPQNEFWLNQHTDKASLLAAIDQIHYHGSGTNTAKALRFVRKNAFTHVNGDRPKAANILIVITDGHSFSRRATLQQAAQLHNLGVNVLAVGVGGGVDTREVAGIASSAQNVYTVSSFDALTTVQYSLEKTACNATVPPPVDGNWSPWAAFSPCSTTCGGGAQYRVRTCSDPSPAYGGADCPGQSREVQSCNTQACLTAPPPTSAAPACDAVVADIQFLLDASGSVGAAGFIKVRDFVKAFADNFDIRPDNVRIGISSFDSTPHNEFWLNRYGDKASLLAAIDNIQYRGGDTYTAEALRFIGEKAFTVANGDRPNVANILIVITDGQSVDQAATLQQATELHNLGVNVLAVGVGGSVDQTELAGIASSAQNVYIVTNFDALTALQDSLERTACAATAPPPVCDDVAADIQFLLDTSGSVGNTNFAKVRAFVKTFADNFDIGPDDVHVGVASFDSTPHNEFWLNQHGDKTSLLAAIAQIQYRGGDTYTAEGLRFIRENAYTLANGDRPNAANILIVITDGQSVDPQATLQQATKLHNLGVNVLAMGVGDSVDQMELAGIASSLQNVYIVSNFDALTTLQDSLERTACAATALPPGSAVP